MNIIKFATLHVRTGENQNFEVGPPPPYDRLKQELLLYRAIHQGQILHPLSLRVGV